MNDIIRFHVPCRTEYTKLVEEVSVQIGTHLHEKTSPQFISKLRAVMNEVFLNIVKHSDTAKQNEVVRFQFEIGIEYFTTSIYDYGPGFAAEGHFPPYPEEVIGKRYKLRDVIDGAVFFTVIDPFSLIFSFEEKAEMDLDDIDNLSMLDDHGLGISIVTKIMDSVTYSYLGHGKYDWKLAKKLD